LRKIQRSGQFECGKFPLCFIDDEFIYGLTRGDNTHTHTYTHTHRKKKKKEKLNGMIFEYLQRNLSFHRLKEIKEGKRPGLFGERAREKGKCEILPLFFFLQRSGARKLRALHRNLQGSCMNFQY
jgi:hypothetical protein